MSFRLVRNLASLFVCICVYSEGFPTHFVCGNDTFQAGIGGPILLRKPSFNLNTKGPYFSSHFLISVCSVCSVVRFCVIASVVPRPSLRAKRSNLGFFARDKLRNLRSGIASSKTPRNDSSL